MAATKSQKKRSTAEPASISTQEEPQRTCSDFLFDLSIDLEEVTGTVTVMSQLGIGRDPKSHADVDIAELCACFRLLEGRLKAIRSNVISALEGTDHEHRSPYRLKQSA